VSRAAGACVAAVALALLAGCGGEGDEDEPEDSGARDVAVEWAELAVAGDPAACELTTDYGGAMMAGWTGELRCKKFERSLEFLPRALLLEDANDLAPGMRDASESQATGWEDAAVTRLTFAIPLGAVEADFIEEDGEWLFHGARAVADPLAGEGSEEIDPAAVEGIDRTDPEAVLGAWAALAAQEDPSACLMTHPRFVYSVARQELAESCADMITSRFPLRASGLAPAELARVASSADPQGEHVDRVDPDEKHLDFRKELPNGDRAHFELSTVDGEWAVESLGVTRHIGPGEPLFP
jgi:hypothetical protein